MKSNLLKEIHLLERIERLSASIEQNSPYPLLLEEEINRTLQLLLQMRVKHRSESS